MYTYSFREKKAGGWKICITNRQLLTGTAGFSPAVQEKILERIALLADRHLADAVILREKDLSEKEYEALSAAVRDLCREKNFPLILHHFADTAEKVDPSLPLHLTMPDFEEYCRKDAEKKTDRKAGSRNSRAIGVSTHTVEEAIRAERMGASYITASHIFQTACKPGTAPRGLAYLREVCAAVHIPVFALGGIHPEQIDSCLLAGASGVCMMSEYFGKESEDGETDGKGQV